MGILKNTVQRISEWIKPGAEPARRGYYRLAPGEADASSLASNSRFQSRSEERDEHLGYWTPSDSD